VSFNVQRKTYHNLSLKETIIITLKVAFHSRIKQMYARMTNGTIDVNRMRVR
jgi:hypothetical protein